MIFVNILVYLICNINIYKMFPIPLSMLLLSLVKIISTNQNCNFVFFLDLNTLNFN